MNEDVRIIKVKTGDDEVSDFEFIDDPLMSKCLVLIGREKADLHLIMREDGKGPFFVRTEDIVDVRAASDMEAIKYMIAMDSAELFAGDDKSELVSDD